LTRAGADLEVLALETAIHQVDAVEIRLSRDRGDLRRQLRNDLLQGGQFLRCGAAIGRLRGDAQDVLQDVDLLANRAVGGLHQRDRLVGVRGCLVDAAELGGEPLRRDVAGRIVSRAVDRQTGRQLLLQATGGVRVGAQRVQRKQRVDVGVDGSG
jgi:hypothetical protein